MEHKGFEEQKSVEQERELADLERKLQIALRPQPAPLGLKQRVLARSRERRQLRHGRWWALQRIAASATLAVVFGGFAVYHQVQEHRRGEEAKAKVLAAFRITNRALEHVNERLTEESR